MGSCVATNLIEPISASNSRSFVSNYTETQTQTAVEDVRPQDLAGVICQYWFRTIIKDDSISIKNIMSIIKKYCAITEILKWSTVIKDEGGFEFSDSNQCITRVNNSTKYRWITADVEPANYGIHCWRVNVNHTKKGSNGGWIVYGVSPPNPDLAQNCTMQDGVWGIAWSDCWYPFAGRCQDLSVASDTEYLYRKNIDVDILLNLEAQTLTIGIVGIIDDKHEYRFKGIERTNKFGGWVPHFNLFASDSAWNAGPDTTGCELRIAQIPPDLYRQCLPYNIFVPSDLINS